MTEFELKKSYFPSQTVSTCNKSRHLRERGKETVRCCLLASQRAIEVIPARQPFYTFFESKLSLCVTFSCMIGCYLHILWKFLLSISSIGSEMVRPGVDGKKYKKIAFPTLLSHFSNYDYRSTNYQCIASLYVISENFNFSSWTVQKWQDHV